MKTKEKTIETDFKGPVSLDAILAATSKKDNKKIVVNSESPISPTTPIVAEKTKEEKVIAAEAAKLEGEKNKLPAQQPAQIVTNTEEETEAFKTALKMIKSGLLEDFSVQISEEDEKGTPISEFKSMTDENLEEIIKIHKQDSESNISSNYISKEGLKEHQLKVIEILKNGGDLSQIAKNEEEAFKRPFEDFDMEDQQRQVDVLYTDLTSGKGLDHDSAITLINKEVKNKTLKESADKIFNSYRKAHAKYIDDKLESQRKDKEFKDLNFKENKKTLVAKLKEAGLKESVYKKVASEYSKKNSNGDYALIDKLKEALNNPEQNHELILHLADKTLFNETFKIKAAQESQKTIVRLASGSGVKGNKKSITTQTEDKSAPWLKVAQIHNENIKKN